MTTDRLRSTWLPASFLVLALLTGYLPAAITVLAARRLHATPAQAFLAGRRVNVLVFGLLGALALAVARRGVNRRRRAAGLLGAVTVSVVVCPGVLRALSRLGTQAAWVFSPSRMPRCRGRCRG